MQLEFIQRTLRGQIHRENPIILSKAAAKTIQATENGQIHRHG
jgi:hypothetical protein